MARYHAMTPLPPSVPSSAKPKQGLSGCLVAVIVVGVLVALVCIGSAIALGFAAQSDEGKKALSMMGKGIALAGKSMNAPGAQEVRDLGCSEAMVMNTGDVMDVVSEVIDGGLGKPADLKTVVMCQGSFGLPTCDEVAAAYRKAPGVEPGPFSVMVKQKGRRQANCEQDY